MSQSLVVPDAAVLVHIGPHKTGTTTIQNALDEARDRLAKSGVVFPCDHPHPRSAVRAITGANGRPGDPPARMSDWVKLRTRIQGVPDKRVVVSSEVFTGASDETIPVILDDLGRDRVHIVVTIRPLAKILPSQWQQRLLNRLTLPFPMWLERVFNEPDSRTADVFWKRHAHDVLVTRWAEAVGPERLTVVVSDERRPRAVLDAFEQLLGVPGRTLRPRALHNRSFTLGEAELIRIANIHARRYGWSDEQYARDVRDTLGSRLKTRTPDPDDPRIPTPAWAMQRAAERQSPLIDAIDKLGVRVIGDLDSLRPEAQPTTKAGEQPDALLAMTRLLTKLAYNDATLTALRTLDVDAARRVIRKRRSARQRSKR